MTSAVRPTLVRAARVLAFVAPLAVCAALASGCVRNGSGSGNSTTNAPTWSKSYGGAADDGASHAIPTADGGYVFVGVRDLGSALANGQRFPAPNGSSSAWIAKLDAFGDLQWQRAIGSASFSESTDVGTRIVRQVGATRDGGYWLVGAEVSGGRTDLFVTRLDAAGGVVWSRSYDFGGFPSIGRWQDGSTAVGDSGISYDIASTAGDVSDEPSALAETRDDGLPIATSMAASVNLSTEDGTFSDDARGGRVVRIGPNGDVYWQQWIVAGPLGQWASYLEASVVEAADGSAYYAADGAIASVDAFGVRWLSLSDEAGFAATEFLLARSGVALAPVERAGLSGAAALDGVVAVGETTAITERATATLLRNDGSVAWRNDVSVAGEGVARAVQAACPRDAAPGERCPMVAIISRDDAASSGHAVGVIQPDGTVSSLSETLRDVAAVCDFRRDGDYPDPLRNSFRAIVQTHDGRIGTVDFDENGASTGEFRELPLAMSCRETRTARLRADGSVMQYVAPISSASSMFVVTGRDGRELLRLEFPPQGQGNESRLHAARSVLQTDDDGDGVADDGYLVAIDTTASASSSAVATLVKLDARGALTWQTSYPGLTFESYADNNARKLVQTSSVSGRPSGFAFVARQEVQRTAQGGVDAANLGVVLMRVTDEGVPLGAAARLQSDAGVYLPPFVSLAATPDGGVVTAAHRDVTKFAATGEVEWRRTLSGDYGSDMLSAIAPAAGGYYVAGGGDWLMRLDAQGAVQWARGFPFAASSSAVPDDQVALDLAPDGGIYLGMTIEDRLGTPGRAVNVAELRAQKRKDIRVLRLDADGDVRWERYYGGLEDEQIGSIEATADGGAVIAARSRSLGAYSEAWLLRVGPDGRVSPNCAAQLSGTAGLGRSVPLTASSGAPALESIANALPVRQAGSLVLRTTPPATEVARQCSGLAGDADSSSLPPPNTSELTVVQGGSITGVVSSVPNGILCGVAGDGACRARFMNGTRIAIQVDPGSRSTFEAWTGCDDVVGTRCDVVVDRARTVTVRFATEPRPDVVALVIDSIEGRGRVLSLRGMDCDPTKLGSDACRENVGRDSTVRLTARPDPRRAFLGWGGACASFGTATQIDVAMSDGRTCSARFDGPPATAPEVAVSLYPELPTGSAQSYTYGGNVTSTPAGIDCGTRADVCLEGFVAGTQVVLRGEATRPGWEFEGFICTGGTHVSTASTVDLGILVSDASCQASFRPDIERLYLQMIADDGSPSPARVYAEDARLDCTTSCDRTFPRDIFVRLRAEPLGTHTFDGWTGCDAQPADPRGGTRPLCEVRMTARRDVRALFSRVGGGGFDSLLLIDYTADSAGGVVTSSPAAINCRPGAGTCSAAFATGTDVLLTLAPDAGGTATSPSGCDTFTPSSGATPATCAVRLTANRTVVVRTTRANAPPVASFTFSPDVPLTGEPVTLDASSSTDDAGIVAYRWDFTNDRTYEASGAVATASYTAAGTYTARLQVEDADGALAETTREITVSEPAERVPLTVSITGTGSGGVFSAPPGINCGADCTEDWLQGTVVDLFAAPAGGSSFAGWTGCPELRPQTNGIPACRATMTAPLSVSAAFAPAAPQATLTLRMQGPGDGVVVFTPAVTACSKSSEPTCARGFANGTVVTLAATAYSGWRVGEWGGCDSVSADSRTCTVTMNANRTVDVFIVP